MPSSVDSVVKLLTGASGFLSGALAATLVTVIVGGVRARRDRETAWLQEQLRSLYGPLAFFTNQNRQLMNLAGRVQDVHSHVFSGNWSQDEVTQEALERKSTATLDLGNRYVKQVGGNNARIMEILEKKLASHRSRRLRGVLSVSSASYPFPHRGGATRQEGAPIHSHHGSRADILHASRYDRARG